MLEHAVAPLAFTFGEFVQIVIFAGSLGGLFMQVRSQGETIKAHKTEASERMKRVEDRQDKLDERVVTAVEDLGASISSLAIDIKSVLAEHHTRIKHIEKHQHHDG